MTRADKWKQRPIVMAYRAYKDELRAAGVDLDIEHFYHVIFVLPMPKSWSQKKRSALRHTPHLQTPDKDNLEKGLLDALHKEDKAAWDGRVSKVWGDRPALIISEANLSVYPEAIEHYLKGGK